MGKYIIGDGFSLTNTGKGERKREKVVVFSVQKLGETVSIIECIVHEVQNN